VAAAMARERAEIRQRLDRRDRRKKAKQRQSRERHVETRDQKSRMPRREKETKETLQEAKAPRKGRERRRRREINAAKGDGKKREREAWHRKIKHKETDGRGLKQDKRDGFTNGNVPDPRLALRQPIRLSRLGPPSRRRRQMKR